MRIFEILYHLLLLPFFFDIYNLFNFVHLINLSIKLLFRNIKRKEEYNILKEIKILRMLNEKVDMKYIHFKICFLIKQFVCKNTLF